jgi:Flp pilus assembly protein TadD
MILAEGMRPSKPRYMSRLWVRYALLVLAEGMRPAPASWLRRRRLRRRFFVSLLVVATLATAVYFAAPPLGEAIKGWQSRRLAHQAFALIDQEKWNEASAKLRDASLLDPHEPEAWRAIARLRSRTGLSTAALQGWKKIDKKHRLTIEDRRDFAGAALIAGELAVAATQIDQLLAQKGGPATIDILLAGQLAVRRQDPALTVNYAERVMSDNRAKPHEILSAATLALSVTRRASPLYVAAWKRIEDLARDPANAASLDALAFLANQQSLSPAGPTGNDTSFSFELGVPAPQQSIPSSPLTGDASLSLGPSAVKPKTATTMGLLEIADALEHRPKARPYHKLLALQLRVRHDPALVEQYVADAVERFGSGDDETLAALAAWLNSLGRAQKTLEVVPLDRATGRRDLYLRYIDALFALERWDEVIDALVKQQFPIDPVLQHMYLAIARSHLGEPTAVTNEWQRALQAAAGDSDKLLALAAYAEQNHANDVADRAYVQAIKVTPKLRAAYTGRLHLAEASGRTAEAQALTAEIVQLWPDDDAAQNEDAYLRLLLGASDGAAEAAERQAQVLVAQEPWNWAARATLGLARLRLGKKKEALAVFRHVQATGSEPPGALAVRAAILAVNGYKKGARGDARLLGAKHLLPEERALIAPLLADQKVTR